MKRLFYIVFLLPIAITLWGQKYYYYNGEKIELQILDSVVQYTYPFASKGTIDERLVQKHIVHKNQADNSQEYTILSREYIIGGENPHRMSNHFYVKLRRLEDYAKLVRLTEETNVILLGEVPYMDKWYKLLVANSLYDNSLDMSNYFYETGLFEKVDPGFVFNFKPHCVTDNNYYLQWALPTIKACQAWEITTGSPSIKIAIVDKGVESGHYEFSSISVVGSYDCITKTSSAQVYYRDMDNGIYINNYHGTKVGGIIFSDHNHANIAGIAPSASLLDISHPLFYEDDDDAGANLASGISHAIAQGADIINCSWGDKVGNPSLRDNLLDEAIDNAFIYGRNGMGCVVVFAAGNEAEVADGIPYPANLRPDIIVVGAINSDSLRADFSSFGEQLDVVAPGEGILTTDHNNTYTLGSGTSFAAPIISGITALMLSVNPHLTQKQVADIIESTTAKVGSIQYNYTPARPNGTWNRYMGYGLVDAYAAVKEAQRRYFQNIIYPRDTSVVEYYPQIYAGYSVTDAIPYGDVIVKQGSNVTYKASEKILLLPGFQVEEGASFLTYIEPFANSTSAPSVIREEEGVNNEEALTTIHAESQSHFSIKPNPASDFITIICAEPIEQIMVYNLSGQLVMQTTESSFAVSAFWDGLYIVRAHMKDGSFYQAKFIKKQK